MKSETKGITHLIRLIEECPLLAHSEFKVGSYLLWRESSVRACFSCCRITHLNPSGLKESKPVILFALLTLIFYQSLTLWLTEKVWAYRSPWMTGGRKKTGFRRFRLSYCVRIVALRQPVGAAFIRQPEVGLHACFRAPLQVAPAVLAQDALQRLAEGLHAERVAVAVGLHVRQIGVVEVATGLQGLDAGVTHVQAVRLGGRKQVAAEVHHRVGVALDAHGFAGILLLLKQRAGVLRAAEALHQLAHDNGQLRLYLLLQLRVALVCRDDFREVQDDAAARHAPAAVGEAHGVVVHGQYHPPGCGSSRRRGTWGQRTPHAAGNRLDARAVAAPLLLVGQADERIADDRRPLARVFQRLDDGRHGVVRSRQHGGDFRHDALAAAAGAGDLQKQLPVVAVRQHHEQRGQNHVPFLCTATGGAVEPLPEVRRVALQRFAVHGVGVVHVAQRAQPVLTPVRAEGAAAGVERAVAKADELSLRRGLLGQHQLERVNHARHLARRKRRAQALKQLRHVAPELVAGNHLPRPGLIAAEDFAAGVHGQIAPVVLRNALRLLAGAHGRKLGLAHGVERAGGGRGRGFPQRLPGGFLTVRGKGVVPVAEHRRQGNRCVAGCGGVLRLTLAVAVQVTVGGNHQRQRRMLFTDEAGQGKEVSGRQRNPHRVTRQRVHGQPGGVALGEPDAFRCAFTAQDVAGTFHLAALKRALVTGCVNQLDVDQRAVRVVQRHHQVAGAVGGQCHLMRLRERQAGLLRQPLAGQVGVAGDRFCAADQLLRQRGGGNAGGLVVRLWRCGFSHRRQVAGQVVHARSRPAQADAQRLLHQVHAVTGPALVAEPRPAPLFIVKAEAVFAAAHRARRVPVLHHLHAQRGQDAGPLAPRGAGRV
ncbi:Hypothetical Protein PANA_2921 [Pantoea ananatis LMG 20103]|uniref:Uncharacterized protein n=1 Tax=Pantoea ananatis (strain LMG 20103) TaxID=706191 RepID=D4GKP9_PANAM|nr:Hypothetical Protein PANA_2921 [Pantoea ananatis LMG 20103]